MKVAQSVQGLSVQRDGARRVTRTLPEEVPVALVFDGTTQAVMMATPADLEDFGLGFALTEGIVAAPGEVRSTEVVAHDAGAEVRMWLADGAGATLRARRRRMAGPVGCGLCGIDSLAEALRPLPQVTAAGRLSRAAIAAATDRLAEDQSLHDRTRAAHAAGFLRADGALALAREDIGRHNALDKLIGALARGGIEAGQGALVVTSRLSVDMLQKAAMAGCPVLIAVSAPTALAVRQAEAAGLTLIAFAKGGGFDIYTHPERIETGASHVA